MKSIIYLICVNHVPLGINFYTSKEAADLAARQHFRLDKFEVREMYFAPESAVRDWIAKS